MNKVYTRELRASREMLGQAAITLDDEWFDRKLAAEIIHKMPIEDLRQLFMFRKIDPHSEESLRAMTNPHIHEAKKRQIEELRRMNQIEYKAWLNF